MSNYQNLLVLYRPKQDEWDKFWSWMWFNTGQHGLGPLRTMLYNNPDEQKIRETEMRLFLTHKDRILTNPPKEKEVFNKTVMRL